MAITREDNIVDENNNIDDSWDGTIKNIVNITGQKKVVYILWGDWPESPEFIKYGFNTEDEAKAFMVGISLMDGYMGWMGAYSTETFGKGRLATGDQPMTEEEFAQEIQGTHDFEEESE